MDLGSLAIPWFAMFVGFFATGMQAITGFGLSIIATPFLLMVYQPQDIVLILQLLCAVINIVFGFMLRHELDKKFFLMLAAGATVGQIAALFIYKDIPTTAIKILISCVILGFLLIMIAHKAIIKETLKRTFAAGFASGILNILVAMSGPPLILYLANTKRSPRSIRATCIIYFAFGNVTALAGFLLAHQQMDFALQQTLYILPASLIGLYVGNRIFPHVSAAMFKRLLFIMLLFSALYTLYSAVA